MFAGNDGGAHTWAVLASLLQTAKLNGLDPFTWLNDVLTRIVSGDVLNNALDQLLAWNWQPAEHPAMRMTASCCHRLTRFTYSVLQRDRKAQL